MLSQCICYTSETYQILSPVLFQQSLYFPSLIHRSFYLLVYISILTEVLHDLHPVCPLGVCPLGVGLLGVCEGLPGSRQGPGQLLGQPGQLRGVLHIGKGEDGMRGDKGQEEEESEAMEYCTIL